MTKSGLQPESILKFAVTVFLVPPSSGGVKTGKVKVNEMQYSPATEVFKVLVIAGKSKDTDRRENIC